MEHACKDREQHIASTCAPWRSSPAQSVSRTVRVRPQTAGGLLPLCKKNLGFVADMRQASYKSNAKTTSPPVTVAKPRTSTYLVGSIRDSVRPEPAEGPVLRALEGPVLRAHEGGPPPPAAPASLLPQSSPVSAGTPPLCAGRHTDTALLPPLRCLRYRLPMAVAISHRNRNITAPHAVGGARLAVGGMVCIDGQRRPVKQHEGLLPLCKKILGFIANLSQASYKSNAKTTSPHRSQSRKLGQFPRHPRSASAASHRREPFRRSKRISM